MFLQYIINNVRQRKEEADNHLNKYAGDAICIEFVEYYGHGRLSLSVLDFELRY